MKSRLQNRKEKRIGRFPLIIGVALLHGGAYYTVNLINSLYCSSAFYNYLTLIDGQIPFMHWTWVFYYFGDVYITVWASIIVLRLSNNEFRQAIYAYTGMIITGALFQIVFPGKAPWPPNLAAGQRFIHNLISMRPYACLPSMHVALTVLPTCFLYSSFKSIWIRTFSTMLAILVTFSTLTLKEHFFLDTLTGVILGLFFYEYWRWSLKDLLKQKKEE